MALPLVIFLLLTIVAVGLFIFGLTRQTLNAGFIFIALSGVILIVTGAMLWSGGLQSNIVSSFVTDNTGTTTVSYQTLTTDVGQPMWVISNIFVYGGVIFVLLTLFATMKQRRQFRREAAEEDY